MKQTITVVVICMIVAFFFWRIDQDEKAAFYVPPGYVAAQSGTVKPKSTDIPGSNIEKICDHETGNLIYYYSYRGGVAVIVGGCEKK